MISILHPSPSATDATTPGATVVDGAPVLGGGGAPAEVDGDGRGGLVGPVDDPVGDTVGDTFVCSGWGIATVDVSAVAGAAVPADGASSEQPVPSTAVAANTRT
jgi:hypothetical protein